MSSPSSSSIQQSSSTFSGSEFRITVVGAGAVGKSALTVRFIQGNFVEKYDPTIEDSYRKQVEIDNTACVLDIMDTAGQEEYSALRDQYMKTGEGFVLVYSVTSRQSFEFTQKLRANILRMKADQEVQPRTTREDGVEIVQFPIVLVGNKKDLVNERQVSPEEGKQLGERFRIPFVETSAKTNENVAEAFHQLVREVSKYREKNPIKKKERKRCKIL